MARVGEFGRVRAQILALSMAAVIGSSVLAVAPVAHGQVAPSAEVHLAPDPTMGGSRFMVNLFNANLPAGDDYIEIYVTRNGVAVSDDPFGNATFIRCPIDTDPHNDPAITNSCSFFLKAASVAGTYLLDINVPYLADSLSASAVLDTSIAPWWNDVTELARSSSIFTGSTDLQLRFNSVPASVGNLNLDAMVDSDSDEIPDRVVGTVPCAGGPVIFTCSTDGGALPPLCTADLVAGQYCDGSSYNYYFAVNGITMQYSFSAIHYRLSRYEEGQYFARQNFNDGLLLGDFLDLDTFLYGSTDICHDVNAPGCYDRAYYRNWVDLFVGSFANAMATSGRFDVVVSGGSVTTDIEIPRLPVGAHGLKAVLAYAPVGNPVAVTRLDLDCIPATCAPVTLGGLSPGEYRFSLNIFNDHPLVQIFDYNYDEIQWGQEYVASLQLAHTVVVGPIVARPGGVGIFEGNEGSRTARVPVRLSRPSPVAITVDWETLDGEAPLATAGTDFVAGSGTVTIPAGQTVGYVSVEVLGDTEAEPPLLWGEWGFVAFSNLTGPAELETSFYGMGVFVIRDDDTSGGSGGLPLSDGQ